MKPINIVMAVVGGAIAGAAVGLLLPPRKVMTPANASLMPCVNKA